MPYVSMSTSQLRSHIRLLKEAGCEAIYSMSLGGKANHIENATVIAVLADPPGRVPLQAWRPTDSYDDWLVQLADTSRFTWHEQIHLSHYFTVDTGREVQ